MYSIATGFFSRGLKQLEVYKKQICPLNGWYYMQTKRNTEAIVLVPPKKRRGRGDAVVGLSQVELDVRLGQSSTLLELMAQGDPAWPNAPVFLHCPSSSRRARNEPSRSLPEVRVWVWVSRFFEVGTKFEREINSLGACFGSSTREVSIGAAFSLETRSPCASMPGGRGGGRGFLYNGLPQRCAEKIFL